MADVIDVIDILKAADIAKKGSGKITVNDLFGEGKIVGLYFSAHWCPPCRAFTPVLATFYNNLKSSGDSKLEILFVSSDRSEKEFFEYFEEMPWSAILFSSKGLKEQLAAKYGINGIPSLIILDGKGNVIDKNGRGTVTANKMSQVLPWC